MRLRSLLLWSGSLLLVSPAAGATVFSTTGAPSNCLALGGDSGVAANGVVVKREWTQTRGYTNVNISAALQTFNAGFTQVTAYLTTQAGPGTTVANQIAVNTVTVPLVVADTATLTTLFSGLTLGPGTYHLTVAGDPNSPPGHPQCWSYSASPSTATDTGVSGIADRQVGGGIAAYPPATSFGGSFGAIALATVTGDAITSPTLSKTFSEVSMGPQNTVALTFALQNPNAAVTLNALAFTDTLPSGLVVATPNGLSGSCGGGTLGAVAASNTISLTGAALAAGASCTFKVNVTANGVALGGLTNTTSTVTSTEAAPGTAASANLFVGDPFQVSYAANLAVGDSSVDITNVGALGASLQSGTTASITGALCANIYAFTPDEQLVSCCSCPVTPNGLVSLSAKNDLASNTLTPAVPTALVIKLVASVPVAGSCNNSAAAVTAASLANGMKSFETTLHATPVAGSYGITETPFSSATMSAGELGRITNLCNFILANGSGFGVCRSCRLGGLGGVRQ